MLFLASPFLTQGFYVLILKKILAPEWRKENVKFGWVRFLNDAIYYPGFVLPDGMCKYITTKSELSSRKFKIEEYHQTLGEANKKLKKKYLLNFNKNNGTRFE